MKLIFTVFLFMGALQAHAAVDEASMSTTASQHQFTRNEPRLGVNADPIWLAVGGLGLKFEYFVSDRVSLGLSGVDIPGHRMEKGSNFYGGDNTFGDYSLTLHHTQIFVGSNIMLTGGLGRSGFYVNPAIGYQWTHVTDIGDSGWSADLATMMFHLTTGYQWIFADHLRLAAGGGLNVCGSGDFIMKDETGNEMARNQTTSKGAPALDMQVGYVF